MGFKDLGFTGLRVEGFQDIQSLFVAIHMQK